MGQCSICSRGQEVANTVNELLDAKTKLRDIEAKTGIGFRSVNRHQHGNCQFSYRNHRASKIRGKSEPSGRLIICWPEIGDAPAHFTDCGTLIAKNDVRAADCLIVVAFETPRDRPFTAALVAEAEREDSLRSPKISESPANERNAL